MRPARIYATVHLEVLFKLQRLYMYIDLIIFSVCFLTLLFFLAPLFLCVFNISFMMVKPSLPCHVSV